MCIKKYEKYLNILWSTIALGMAYSVFQEILFAHEWDLLVWLFIHVMVAVLFLIRSSPIYYSSSITGYLVAIASVNYYLLFDFKNIDDSFFYSFGNLVMLIGGIMCFVSTLSLGSNFGVLPINRGVKTTAAYSFVRHPIYLSYIVLDAGIIMAFESTKNCVVFFAAIFLYILRIRYEEEVMERSEEYKEYKKIMKYKLIPFVYCVY